MSDAIFYRRKYRGNYTETSILRSVEDPIVVRKPILVFDSPQDLLLLGRMKPNETVKIGDEKMSFSRFREEILGMAQRIYINSDSQLIDMMRGQ